jgi:hypothetical protein
MMLYNRVPKNIKILIGDQASTVIKAHTKGIV